MVSAMCPNCHIILIEANDNSFNNLALTVDEAAKLGANAISNSYGGGESGFSFNSHYHHAGHIILASSGDSGFAGGPQFPADSQYVVAVGGTSLTKGGGTRGWTESVWAGTGSGCSAVAPKPSWQKDTGCSRRTIGDASADANPGTGPAMYDVQFGGWLIVGGTSVSSPLLGGIYGLAGNAGTLNAAQSLYTKELHLFDITTGSNGVCTPKYLCHATSEYSGPAGNGSPDGLGAF
jgi:subtilase family serine protease